MTKSLEQLSEVEVDHLFEEITFEKWRRDYSENKVGRDYSNHIEYSTKLIKNSIELNILITFRYFSTPDEESDGVTYPGYSSKNYSTKVNCSGFKIYESENSEKDIKRYYTLDNETSRRQKEKEENIKKKKELEEEVRLKKEKSKIEAILSKLRR